MPLTGKDALDLHEKLGKQAEQERLDRLQRAKADAAARGKEPFDYGKLTSIAQTVYEHTMRMSETKREEYFEELYYTGYPSVLSLSEFAEKVNELSRWM